jgi:hypothetical protein
MVVMPETIGSPDGPTVEGASPALLRDLLNEFERELRDRKVPVDDYFAPGASKRDIRAEFESNGLIVPAELVVWFEWHNGATGVRGSEYVIPIHTFASLRETFDWYDDPGGWPKGLQPWQWNPNWLQITRNGSGIAVCCEKEERISPLARAVTPDGEFGTQPDKTARQVVSLCTAVVWWIDGLRTDAYVWQPQHSAWKYDHARQPLLRAVRRLS